MGRHRAEPPRRRAEAPGRRRRPGQPRYGRLAVLGASVSVTGIAMLGGVGVLPSVAGSDGPGGVTARDPAGAPSSPQGRTREEPASQAQQQAQQSALVQGQVEVPASGPPAAAAQSAAPSADAQGGGRADDVAVPEDSGEGRRVVFDESAQRVWLVGEEEEVERTYLVSGSLYDNLDPGTYEVYSRSEHAVGIDDSGTMQYFVRFTEGDNGAAIGFHDIPVDDGSPVQTRAQLGTPQSHGCIRQERDDAVALWEFAPIGTRVDVVA